MYNAKENGRKLYNDSDDMSPFDSEENDSNDENNPANEYPDSYTESDDENEENIERHKPKVNLELQEYIRKKSNYAGNKIILDKIEDAVKRSECD